MRRSQLSLCTHKKIKGWRSVPVRTPSLKQIVGAKPGASSSNIRSAPELSKTHTSLTVASRLGGDALTIEKIKQKTEYFYQWARGDFWVRKCVKLLLLCLAYCIYKVSDQFRDYRALQRGDELTERLLTNAERVTKASTGARLEAKQVLQEFAYLHGLLERDGKTLKKRVITDAELDALEERLTEVLRPEQMTMADFWSAKLAGIAEEKLVVAKAYERKHNLASDQFLSNRVVIAGKERTQEHSLRTVTQYAEEHLSEGQKRALKERVEKRNMVCLFFFSPPFPRGDDAGGKLHFSIEKNILIIFPSSRSTLCMSSTEVRFKSTALFFQTFGEKREISYQQLFKKR